MSNTKNIIVALISILMFNEADGMINPNLTTVTSTNKNLLDVVSLDQNTNQNPIYDVDIEQLTTIPNYVKGSFLGQKSWFMNLFGIPRAIDALLFFSLDMVHSVGVNIMREIVKAGGNINVRDAQGNTLLHWAIRHDRTDAVKFLLKDMKANTHARNDSGITPLHCAACGEFQILQIIVGNLSGGIDVRNDTGATPLCWAAGSNFNEAKVKLLLKNGANPTIADNNGWTVLHYAARSGSYELIH